MFPELAGDPDGGEKLLELAYAGMELPTKLIAETAPIAAAETPIKKIRGRVPKKGKMTLPLWQLNPRLRTSAGFRMSGIHEHRGLSA